MIPTNKRGNRGFPLFTATLCSAVLGLLVLPASASDKGKQVEKNLDLGLLNLAPRVAAFLSNKGYRSVGVLPFQVQKGSQPPSYHAAPLSTLLPGQLENALILSMGSDEKTALQIIRDAATTARQNKVGAWSKDKVAFNRLFETKYPLAWGTHEVHPDVFLTGLVSNTGDRSTTTLELYSFDKKSWSAEKVEMDLVARMAVRTDRALLRDLGYPYSLSSEVLHRDVTPQKRDEEALLQIRGFQAGNNSPVKGDSTRITVAGMAFSIYYNKIPQTIRWMAGSDSQSPVYEVDPIPPGTKVEMVLTRVSDEDRRLGVIVKVNGLSTFQQEDRESQQCRKWLYDRNRLGKPDPIEGFYLGERGERVMPFRVLGAAESAARAAELGARAGWIDVDVFAAGEAGQEEEELMISTRGLARQGFRPATLADLQKQLMKVNHVRKRKSEVVRRTAGGLIVADLEPVPSPPAKEGSLPFPVHLGGISIKYYDRPSSHD